MANKFTQIYIQLVFAVKHRESLIRPEFKDELYKYIGGIFRNKEQKLLAINGMPDHIHIFFSMEPDIKLSDFIRDLKSDSSTFINEKIMSKFKFHWQSGYGAFSYGHSQKDQDVRYVMNQEKHHRKITFREEYLELLKRFEVEYNKKFLFEFFD
jgi:putative transposase